MAEVKGSERYGAHGRLMPKMPRIAFLLTSAMLGLVAMPALSQEMTGQAGIALSDPPGAPGETPATILNLSHSASADRFPSMAISGETEGPRQVELELAAGGAGSGMPLDISIAPRASLGANSEGDISREAQGAEVRLGQGLSRSEPSDEPRWYIFAASDDEALTWQPGARNEFGGRSSSLSLQDRVEIGDMQAGVTYERNGVQASLAYVDREVSSTVGIQTISRDESFTGVTLTMRR